MMEHLENTKDDFIENVKKAHEEKTFKVAEVEFTLTSINFLTRRKIFAYFTSIREYLDKGDFSFMSEESFDKIMQTVDSKVAVNGIAISTDKEFWDKNANCYIEYVAMVLMVLSYPFFADKITS